MSSVLSCTSPLTGGSTSFSPGVADLDLERDFDLDLEREAERELERESPLFLLVSFSWSDLRSLLGDLEGDLDLL